MTVYDLDLDAEGAPRFVVDKADYDALAARLAEAETLLRVARVALDDAGSGLEWSGYLETIDQFFRRRNADPV